MDFNTLIEMARRRRKTDLEQEIRELQLELDEARLQIQHSSETDAQPLEEEVQIRSPAQPRAAIQLPHQEHFDGTRPWESFIFSFQNIAEACGWNKNEKRFRILACLRGNAADFAFQQLSSDVTGDFDNLVAALNERFENRKTPASFVSQLEARRLGPKETIADYAADVRRLTTFGYPSAYVDTIETISTRHFLRGIGDQNMTLTVGMHEPKSLQEAREIAERYFNLREESSSNAYRPIRALSSSQSVSVTEGRLADFERRVMSIDERLNTLSSLLKDQAERNSRDANTTGDGRQGRRGNDDRGRQPRGGRPMHNRCYECDREGHLARNCPNPRYDNRRYQQQQPFVPQAWAPPQFVPPQPQPKTQQQMWVPQAPPPPQHQHHVQHPQPMHQRQANPLPSVDNVEAGN